MKISANSIKCGYILVYENNLWLVVKNPEHTKPGKGPAYIQLEMKNLKTNTKVNKRLNSSDTVEKAVLDERECQYLYLEDNELIFMYTDTFEQISISKDILGSKAVFLNDGIIVTIVLYQENPINVILPSTVVLEITETEPIIKGAAVNPGYKNAILSNGLHISVPHYLTIGEKIILKTEDHSFVSRVK